MIELTCTRKLADDMKLKLQKSQMPLDDLHHWYGEIFTFERRKTLVAVQGATHFGIILWGITAKEYKNLGKLLHDAIRSSLALYGYKDEKIQEYLPDDEIRFSLSSDHKGTSAITKATDTASWCLYRNFQEGEFFQRISTLHLNDYLVKSGETGKYGYAREFFLSAFQRQYGEEVLEKAKFFRVKAVLNLEVHKAERTLLIPTTYTFKQIHKALNIAFGWLDCHLYQFTFGDEQFVLEYSDFALLPDQKESLMDDVSPRDYLEIGSSFRYEYDFGDGWCVDCTVLDIEEKEGIHASCEQLDNPSAPENCGGVGGFVDFFQAYTEVRNPRNEEAVSFAESQEWDRYPSRNEITARMREI